MSCDSFEYSESLAYKYAMYAYGIAATVCFLFATFTVWFCSPKSFGLYKYFLLNITICAFIYDFYMCIIFQPKVVLPTLALCPNGIAKSGNDTFAKILMFIWYFLMGCNIVSVLSAFIYRCGILHNYLQVINSKKFIAFLIFLHLFYHFPIILAYAYALRNSDANRILVYQEFPQVKNHISNLGCSITHFADPFTKNVLLPMAAILFTCGMPIIILLVIKSFIALKNGRSFMTLRTYEMHRQLLQSLIFQLLIPSASIFIPAAVMIFLLAIEIQDISFFPQIIYILNASHSFFNTFMMLYFIKPYRRKFLMFIGIKSASIHPHVVTPTTNHQTKKI